LPMSEDKKLKKETLEKARLKAIKRKSEYFKKKN